MDNAQLTIIFNALMWRCANRKCKIESGRGLWTVDRGLSNVLMNEMKNGAMNNYEATVDYGLSTVDFFKF